MFFIRLTLWMVVIIALIPTNIDAKYSLYNITTSTFKDIGSFCSRNPGTCKQTREAAHHFKEKAIYATQVVMGFLQKSYDRTAALKKKYDEQKATKLTKSPVKDPVVGKKSLATFTPPAASQKGHYVRPENSQNTLKADDLNTEWVVPSGNYGI